MKTRAPWIFGDRPWRLAFLALIVLNCSPFWLFTYFPSQDGPSHLHNATVLANYASQPIYRQYYRITPFQPTGVMLTQYMAAALLKLTGPYLAEKLLLSGYVILFFLSFRYLLAGLTASADCFALFAGVFGADYFLYMGFWNFCYSVCFLLFTVGYYIRRRARRWTPGPLVVLAAAGLLLYTTHAVSWVVCVVAFATLNLPRTLSAVRGRQAPSQLSGIRAALWQYALPLSSLVPSALFLLVNVPRTQQEPVPGAAGVSSLRALLWPLYSLSFLHSVAASDMILAKAVGATLAVAVLSVAALALWRRQYRWRGAGVLLSSLACVLLILVVPDTLGLGLFIHKRIALYAWLFLVVWLALQRWPHRTSNMLAALFCAMAVIAMVARYPVLSAWNRKLSGFVALGSQIRPGSTVLQLSLEPGTAGVDPYLHAVGLLSSGVIVDLANYEAATDLFLTRFRPECSPIPALGTVKQLEAVPPVFDIVRYEERTHCHVDYLLFQGGGTPPGEGLYASQMANYAFVSSDRPGNLRLYRRSGR